MAKIKSESVDDGIPPVENVEEMTIEKYFQLHEPEISPYLRAYAENRFHGIMKSKGSWKEAITTMMEGKK